MFILFGKKLNDNKFVKFGLTNIFGIGIANATKICNILNIPQTLKIFELTESQKLNISTYMKQNFIVETKLKQKLHEDIENFITINCVKGFRHRSKLPVRGQRTHSNASTCKKIKSY